jgi:hypothetical protein
MIKRYFATKDNTITNAFQSDLSTRATGSNMGQSDIVEVFTIYGQVSSSVSGFSKEKARVLIQFDVDSIKSDRTSGTVPSGASYYLKMYNASHSQTLPRDYTLEVIQLNAAWEEGLGLDMEDYDDLTYDIKGSNWIQRSGSTSWSAPGGDLAPGATYFTADFPVGNEDMEIDITSLVNLWNGDTDNNGMMIRLSSSLESQNLSYYTKMFFGRGTNRYFDRPVIEARWDSSSQDDRGKLYLSSSTAPAADNLNTIYMYNYVRGRLQNIPSIGQDPIMVSLFSGSSANTAPSGSALQLSIGGGVQSSNQYAVTGGWVSTGVYSASFAYTGSTSIENIYDVWFSGSNSIPDATTAALQFKTGSITIDRFEPAANSDTNRYVLSVVNKQNEYYYNQTHRIRLYARQKQWCPNIYTTATSVPNSLVFPSASYQVYRIIDDRPVIPYDTGSVQGTRLSYDVSGNYFDLDTSFLEPNYSYGVKFSIYDPDTSTYEEQSFTYKLRVVNNEY